ncbi:hypothetical protein KIN20_022752 [Parelaphostrongylus tenuis]|uniref:Uncharacterized protein n=1 Tax=Parelaphostrongylus tenuis TaxID=148309 RepID=A0AAD5MUK3_PARTN|nr:hypothetical protein KIN20_022752 [Parelaphostrongylus tenuis]
MPTRKSEIYICRETTNIARDDATAALKGLPQIPDFKTHMNYQLLCRPSSSKVEPDVRRQSSSDVASGAAAFVHTRLCDATRSTPREECSLAASMSPLLRARPQRERIGFRSICA